LPGESAEPVTAHEIMTLRCMLTGSLSGSVDPIICANAFHVEGGRVIRGIPLGPQLFFAP
jgi:hypothetical protein